MRLLPPKATLVILDAGRVDESAGCHAGFKNYKVLDFNNIPSVLDFTQRKASAAPIDDEQLRLHPDRDPASYKIFRLNDPSTPWTISMRPCSARNPPARRDHPHLSTMEILHNRRSDHRRHTQAHAEPLRRRRPWICLLAKPWAWYGHNGVEISSSGWSIDAGHGGQAQGRVVWAGRRQFPRRSGAHTDLVPRIRITRNRSCPICGNQVAARSRVSAQGKPLGSSRHRGPAVEPGYATFDLPPARGISKSK